MDSSYEEDWKKDDLNPLCNFIIASSLAGFC